jgi:hypothetical protein
LKNKINYGKQKMDKRRSGTKQNHLTPKRNENKITNRIEL